MLVMKFGGTSVGGAQQIHAAARIVSEVLSEHPVVILSAMGGVTDALLRAGEFAVQGRTHDRDDQTWEIRSRHDRAINELFKDRRTATDVQELLRPIWEEMQKVYTGVSLLREMSVRSRDLISSFGERLMVPLFAHYLQTLGMQAEPIDARELILTSDEADFMLVDFAETRRRCERLSRLAAGGVVPVVTGFICASPEGVTRTLGRGSSDYSATIVGSCVKASEIQIWTDVDGVMTADPRIVPEARVLERVSYREAAEMSYFGAKVLHPKTIIPAADENIPIRIKNTFNPSFGGTLISAEAVAEHNVKTVTSITSLSMVSIEGRGMMGMLDVAARVFRTTAENRIQVLMFSQGSSEQHISLVVAKADGEAAVRVLRREFQHEIDRRRIDSVSGMADVAIIALVGEGMKSASGVAARAFGALETPAINILMIAQGSSELNLSFVVNQRDVQAATRLLHAAFELNRGA
jgi:aspartate kinase